MVYVNVVGAESPELPFGGINRSGFSRELGNHGVDELESTSSPSGSSSASTPEHPS